MKYMNEVIEKCKEHNWNDKDIARFDKVDDCFGMETDWGARVFHFVKIGLFFPLNSVRFRKVLW